MKLYFKLVHFGVSSYFAGVSIISKRLQATTHSSFDDAVNDLFEFIAEVERLQSSI